MMKRVLAATAATMLSFAAPAGAAELVTNGGFESGDFSGWTQNGNTTFTSVISGLIHSGSYAARLGPTSAGTLTQSLDTIMGETYTLSFWLRKVAGSPNDFFVYFDSAPILLHLQDSDGFQYVEYSFTKTTANAPSQLAFVFNTTPGFWYLDDVSVQGPAASAVPEPAAWAMMIGGFGLVGGSLRRAREKRAAFA